MENVWKLARPRLVLTVTGGARDLQLSVGQKNSIMLGLLDVAKKNLIEEKHVHGRGGHLFRMGRMELVQIPGSTDRKSPLHDIWNNFNTER